MPLEQVSNNITFYAFFVSSKQGVTGLTVTADLYRNGTAILTAQACTAVGGGLYSYTLPSANVNAEGEYICLFKTASTAVDQQHIPAIWCVAKAGVEYLDAQVTSRAAIADYTTARAANLDNLDAAVTSRLASGNVTVGSYAAGQDPATLVWGAGTRTLTGFGFTVTVGTNNDKTGYALAVAPPTVANIWDAATSGMATVGSVGKRIADYVDAAVSSRLATSGYTAPDNTSIGTILSRADVATSTRASAADYTTARAAKIDNLDATISSRLAPDGITSMQADVTAIKTPVVANLDTTISSRLAPAGITSMQADVTAIKTPVVTNLDAAITSRADKTYYTNARAARLDRLDIDVSAIISSTSGIGSNEYVTTILNPATGAPLDGVATWVTADAAGSQFIAGTRHTDGQGKVTYMLDYGTYYMWFQLNGWEFNNPTQFTVA